jgi:transposase
VATDQKKARDLGATLVFWDESGFLMQPLVQSTWALRGETPVLRHNAKRMRRVSAIGLLTVSPRRRRLGCYYLLEAERSIDETLVVAVLRQMRRHFRGPVMVLWDRLHAHCSTFVRDCLARMPDMHVEYFPSYTPELNPVEYLWADSKKHDLAHFCPHDIDELLRVTQKALSSKRTDQHRIAGYIRQAQLPLRLSLTPLST